ncbi:Clr5 domain-containing protein [Fusarium sp. LHS14.1]|nr:Clr5 domain-containing protein [Fusarium sp. LHS14.1]
MPGLAAYATSRGDWEKHKDTIIRLYLTEDTPLDKALKTMQSEFGFKTTKRMYSSKLKEWGVMKNYKAKEKDMLVGQICEALANGQDQNQMIFRGQSVKHHRILRHCRAKAREASSATVSLSHGDPVTNHQLDALLVHTVDQPSRNFSGTSPAELILLSTKTYIQSFVAGCHVDDQATARSFPSQASCSQSPRPPPNVQTNQFWHDFETAVYLLRIGSTALGWSTFHTCWGTATDNLLPQPVTLLRKVMTTLHPRGGLTRYHEVSRSTLAFIADLLEMKLGVSHPLAQICLHVWRDSEGPRTAESTLKLMSNLLEENLGPCHHESFLTATALIARHLQNGNVAAAERSARRLVQKSDMSPDRATQLPKALRQLAHVLTTLGQYKEAIEVQEGILNCPGTVMSGELRIYTMEDIAELHRLQGDFFMESESLREALLAAREFFGRGQTPTLHIWDKFAASMSEQGRDFEGL